MSQYEKCCQCSGWINTRARPFMAIHMHNGKELVAHRNPCSEQFYSSHAVEIKSMQAVRPFSHKQ